MDNGSEQISKSKNIDSFAVLIVIYFSNDTLLFGTNINRFFFWIHIVVLSSLLVYFIAHSKYFIKANFFVLMGFIVMILGTLIMNMDMVIKYPYEIVILLLSFLFVQQIKLSNFKKYFCLWIEVICWVSIGLFVIALVVPSLISLLPSMVNISGITYRIAIFSLIEPVGFSSVPRVYGIFREPGVYMIYIALALIFETILSIEVRFRRVISYILGMLITFSTGGYLALLLIGIIQLISLSLSLKRIKKTFLLLLIATISTVIFLNVIGVEKIDKLLFNKFRVSNVSYDSRIGSVWGNLRMMSLNPILGKGFTFFEKNFTIFASYFGYENAHNTNTFLKMLSVHGLFYSLVCIYGVFRFIRKQSKSLIFSILVFLVIIILFSNADLMVNTLLYVIIAYGISPRVIASRIYKESYTFYRPNTILEKA